MAIRPAIRPNELCLVVAPGVPSSGIIPPDELVVGVAKKDEGAAHSIQARRSLLQQRPDTFAQTNSVIFTFRLQYGGGPYIPVCR